VEYSTVEYFIFTVSFIVQEYIHSLREIHESLLGVMQGLESFLEFVKRIRCSGRVDRGIVRPDQVPLFIWIKVIFCPRTYDIGIVDGSRNGDGAGRARIDMAQRKGERLKSIGAKAIFIIKYRVMGRSAGAQESSVTLKVEVKFSGMSDLTIDDSASRAIATPIGVPLRLREETDMVALSNNDDCDLGIDTQLLACLL